ncbi:hypothetical protein C8J56DRAFT_961926 [Mycena floridula]|nr:hypothetical protein C8J56DRAFT_961926 [Mycena floridula]
MTLQTLKVDNDGTTLAFSDSGKPGTSDYTTIFALHGICFNGHVFKRIQAIAASNNIRLVAINRRLYKGSTPLTEAEAMILITSSGEEKADFINTRGLEIATLVDSFIQSAQLPPVSSDGKGDPPSLIFGLPAPPANWAPQVDTSIPEETRIPMFTRWITSYFDHGDLSTKSWDSLTYVLPSTSRRPTIYASSAEEITEMIEDTVDEIPGMVMSQTQANAVYRKACYSDEVKALTPHLKTTLLVGEKSCPPPPPI